MLEKDTPIALILRDQNEISIFTQAFTSLGYRRITHFTKTSEAYEVLVRQLFPILVTRMEMEEMSGVVLLQKLRMTGNYGHESNLFVCDKLNQAISNILYEFDIEHVCANAKAKHIVNQKVKYFIESENNLSEIDKDYRSARSAFYTGVLDLAEHMAKKLAYKDPNTDRIFLLLGDIAAKKDDASAMFNFYTKALKANPKSTAAAQKLAETFMKQGDYKRATQLLDSLTQLNPYHLAALQNAGLSHLELNHLEEAEKYVNKIRNLDQKNQTASEIKVESQIKKGNYDNAVDEMKLSHSEIEIISYLNNAGVKLAKGEDVKGALTIYKSCLSKLKGSKYLYAVHYNIGLAYLKLGDEQNAKEAFLKSLEINPDFKKSKNYLRRFDKSAS